MPVHSTCCNSEPCLQLVMLTALIMLVSWMVFASNTKNH